MEKELVTIYTIAYNEEIMLPYFIKWYRDRFLNCRIVIYNNESTDRTVEIAKENNCEVITYSTNNQLSDSKYLEIKNNCWKEAKTDWVICCFTGNTMIESSEGIVKIQNIKIGDLVKTHKGDFKKVIKLYKTPYKQRNTLIEIDTENCSSRCTPNHPFLVQRNNNVNWIKAEDLNLYDVLLYPNKDSSEDSISLNIKLNSGKNNSGKGIGSKKNAISIDTLIVEQDFAEFLGLYVAEGNCSKGNGIALTFNNNEKDFIELVEKVSLKYFKRNPSKSIRWATTLRIDIKQLEPIFRSWFGNNAHDKKIPQFIKNWNLKNKLAFIKGYLEGDATKSPNKKYFNSVSSASKTLIVDILDLMNNCGIKHKSIIKKFKNYGNFGVGNYNYKTTLSKHSYSKLLDLLNAKQINSDYLGIPIKNIHEVKMACLKDNNYVYNLEVEGDHSYIVNSYITHNCDVDELLDIDYEKLKNCKHDIIQGKGFEMCGEGEEIFKINKGVYNKGYSKLICFNKNKVKEINYEPGCHKANPFPKEIKIAKELYNLYHFKWISYDYVNNRYKLFSQRLSKENILKGWGIHYNFSEDIKKNYYNDLLKNRIELWKIEE